MEPRAGIGSLTLILVVVAVLGVGRGSAAAQADPQTLTVTVAVCPMGYEGDDLAGDCGDRMVRAFDVSVTDISSSAPFASDIAPGGDGRTTVDLTGHTPANLTIGVNTAVNVGSRAVSCISGGVPLPAEIAPSNAGIPIIQLDADAANDISCTVYLYGFADDVALLDVATTGDASDVEGSGDLLSDEGSVAASSATGGDAGTDAGSQVAALPNTGSGYSLAPSDGAGHVLLLAFLLSMFTGGAICLRRRGHASF